MSNLVKAERYKLVHNYIYWLLLAAYIVLGFTGVSGYDDSYSAVRYDAIEVKTISDFFCSMSSDLIIFIIPISALLALFTGREFYRRNLSVLVASGHERMHILLSKLIVKIPACFIILLAYPLSGTIRMISVYGAAGLGHEMLMIVKTMAQMFLCSSVVFALAILFAFFIKNGIVAGVANAIVTFVMTLMFATFAGLELNFINFVNPFYYMRDILDPVKGFINVQAVLVSIVLFAVLYASVWNYFRKSEIK